VRLSRWRVRRLRRGVLRTRVAPIERMTVWRQLVSHYVSHDVRAARALAALVARDRKRVRSDLLPDDPLRRSVRIDAAWQLILPPNWAAPYLLATLTGTGRPALTDPAYTLSLLALGRDALPAGATAWTDAHELIAATTRHGGHPLGAAARSYLLARADPALTEWVCQLALEDPEPREPNLAWWCRTHRLAPADPLRRANFHLRLGDIDAYRGTDPDGTLLATIYRAADPDRRFELRQALVAAGDFDLLRRLTAAGTPFRLDRPERADDEELVDLLVAAEDWPRLWGHVLDAPLDTAITISRRMVGWEPAGAAELFGRLRAADPGSVHRTILSLRRYRPYEIPQGHIIDPLWAVSPPLSIAPDGSRLVLADRRTGLIEIGTGAETPAALHPVGDDRVVDVLHLGTSIVTVQSSPEGRRNGRPKYRLVRYVPGRRPRVLRTADQPARLLRTPDGFVTLLSPDLLIFGTAADADGLRAVRLSEDRDPAYSAEDFLKASDADTGQILICLPHPHERWQYVALVLDGAGNVIARSAPGNNSRMEEAVFAGPDRIVSDGLTSWRVIDGSLIRERSVNRYSRAYPDPPSLFPVGIHGVIGFIQNDELRFADAATLDPVADPFADPGPYTALYFDRQAGGSLRPPEGYPGDYWPSSRASSPDQTYHQGDGRVAWRTRSTLTAYEPVLAIVGAMTERGPGAFADQTTLARALVPARGDVADVIDLLQARLTHRYDTEIALGSDPGQPAPRADDISISRPADGPV